MKGVDSMARKKCYTRNVGILLSDVTYEKLLTICDVKEISISEWIRDAIEIKFRTQTSNMH